MQSKQVHKTNSKAFSLMRSEDRDSLTESEAQQPMLSVINLQNKKPQTLDDVELAVKSGLTTRHEGSELKLATGKRAINLDGLADEFEAIKRKNGIHVEISLDPLNKN